MDSDDEAYVLLLLSDGNLPTGSFVASSGLESYVKHGFFLPNSPTSTINFIQDSLATYARSALPFVSDAHRIVEDFSRSHNDAVTTLSGVKALDELYESMTLNHVAKRASKSQGVALLTLYSKGFSQPTFLVPQEQESGTELTRERRLVALVDQLKSTIRRDETQGHLPICWGVLTGALQLSLERAQYLHLFLHARSLLSAAVRLNILGPYGAQQLLLHAIRPLIEREVSRCKDLHTGIHKTDVDFDETVNGPATTWPLGEILATRHDLQHSRIFNS